MCSVVFDSVTPWTVARQAPLSVEFPRQAYWSGLPFPTPEKHVCILSAYFYCLSHWWLWKLGKENHTSVRSGNHLQNFFYNHNFLCQFAYGEGFQYSQILNTALFLWAFFFFNNVCLITKVIYVHLKICTWMFLMAFYTNNTNQKEHTHVFDE